MKLYRYNIDNLENKNLNHMYLEERQRAEIEQINLSRQIKQYMIGLEQAMTKLISISNYYRASNNNSSALKQIQLMKKKMEFEIEKYKQTLSRIQNKVMTKGGINNIKSYLSSNYNTLVRECHQLISMCGNKVKQPTSHDFKKIKQFQHEMDQQWNISENRQYKPNNSYSVNMYSKSRISTKQQKQQQSTKDSILKAATAQIQQQFLAIRLIAYKMYEKHNSHHHDKIFNQMQILREEQNKLSKQVNQMKQRRMNLLQEQRRMVAELTEIKKINQLIGRRYFIEGSRVDTNFTTH